MEPMCLKCGVRPAEVAAELVFGKRVVDGPKRTVIDASRETVHFCRRCLFRFRIGQTSAGVAIFTAVLFLTTFFDEKTIRESGGFVPPQIFIFFQRHRLWILGCGAAVWLLFYWIIDPIAEIPHKGEYSGYREKKLKADGFNIEWRVVERDGQPNVSP